MPLARIYAFSTLQNILSITYNICLLVEEVSPSVTLYAFEVNAFLLLVFVDLPHLVHLITGPDVFRNAQTCLIHDLPELINVIIGYSSFAQAKKQLKHLSGKLEIVNCKRLEAIEVRDSSFTYLRELKLEELDSLRSLVFKEQSFINTLKLQIMGMNEKL